MKIFFALWMCLFASPVAAEVPPYNRTMPVLDVDADAIATAFLVTDTLAVTAAHAVHTSLQPLGCGKEVISARLIRLDMKVDLALFVLEKPCKNVDVSPVAKAPAPEGSSLVVQGYPGTNTRRTTTGFVSNYEILRGPPVPRYYMIMDLIISGGNSGGPVLNSAGYLVGMVQGKLCYNVNSPDGQPATCWGAAIPVMTIKAFLGDMIAQ